MTKLELIWPGKEKQIQPEPRVLIEDKTLSNTERDPSTPNMLIHGDNLLALKALEQKYAGKVKCVYIDPPYNTSWSNSYYIKRKEVHEKDRCTSIVNNDKHCGLWRFCKTRKEGRMKFFTRGSLRWESSLLHRLHYTGRKEGFYIIQRFSLVNELVESG